MPIVLFVDVLPADPTERIPAPLALHMVTAIRLVNPDPASGAPCRPSVELLQHETSCAFDFAVCLMHGVTTLPTCFMSILADNSPSKAEAARASDCMFASWLWTPFQSFVFAYLNVIPDCVILLKDFCRTEGLDLLWLEDKFATLLHAGKFHCITGLNAYA